MKVAQRSNCSGSRKETPGSASVMSLLEQPLDRQQREEADPRPAEQSGVRLRGVTRLAVEPLELAVGKAYLVGVARELPVERLREARREGRAVDHDPHFGV